MKSIIINFLLLITFTGFGQTTQQFTEKYNEICKSTNGGVSYDSWAAADIVVFFNYQNTIDALIVMGDGSKIYLTRLHGDIKTEKFTDGVEYQLTSYVDDSGGIILLKYYDKGMMLIFENNTVYAFKRNY